MGYSNFYEMTVGRSGFSLHVGLTHWSRNTSCLTSFIRDHTGTQLDALPTFPSPGAPVDVPAWPGAPSPSTSLLLDPVPTCTTSSTSPSLSLGLPLEQRKYGRSLIIHRPCIC